MNLSMSRLIELHKQFSAKGLSVKEMREYDNLTRTNLDALINAYLLAVATRGLSGADWKSEGNGT